MNPAARVSGLTSSSLARLRLLARALGYFRPDLGRIVLSMALLLTSIGVNLLKPWPLAVLVDSVLGSQPFPAWLPSELQHWAQPAQITAIVAVSLALHLTHSAICAGHVYVTIAVGLRGLRRVRDDVFGWLQRLSLRYHHGTEAGDVIFRAGTDTAAFQTLFQQGLLIVVSAVGTLVFMAFMMARLNLYLTAVALVAVPVLLLSIKVFGGAMRSRAMDAQRAESKVYSLIHQGITALPLIQSHAREEHEQRRFTAHTERARRHKMAQQGLEVLFWCSISVILAACTLGVTWVGAHEVLAANLTLGELLVFLAYVAQLFEPLHQLSQVGATLSSASASTRRVFEILDTPEEVKDRPQARPVRRGRDGDGQAGLPTSADDMFASAAPALPAGRPLQIYGNVAYDDVSFDYEPSRSALRHVSFKLLAGTSAAIIGPSGAGKTTLLNLLPRFFDPKSGAILLEGVDLRDLRLEDLRAQIGLVLQKPIILPATVAENIAYGKPSATMAEIEAAAHYANAGAFIEKLPQRYQTVVGDGGARLSVGEKQRINLARAFLKDAPILLMDEPTSALDVESEAQVVASLFALMRGRTTLMVAHRLTTIRRVDQILVLEEGRLTEMGSPDDLLAKQGYYARVVSGQLDL
ncbi:MAG TPA: ABC transporter ATP-binding protein [Methylomirabilota bacterium]|jgi:ATP-binding cassette subfamily B protein/subfamily B ATP-binding cassette protein MsbA